MATSVSDAYHAWRRMQGRIALLVVLGVPALLIALVIGLAVRANRRDAPRADEWSAEAVGGAR